MRRPLHVGSVASTLVILTIFLGVPTLGAERPNDPDSAPWPAVTRFCRPWIYWHWMGSAVNKPELTRHFDMYRKAGLGGVHIIPIYGAAGYESQYIEYLSPQWMEMLAWCLTEAERNDMGVDMTSGTGWNFGGPWIKADDACLRAVCKTYRVEAGAQLAERLQRAEVDAVVAYPERGEPVELTGKLGEDGALDWIAPAGTWNVYVVTHALTRRMVKRAAPGGEGYMINPFSQRAMDNFLARFTEAFAGWKGPMPRAFYNDSYEYANDWSSEVLAEFRKRRGYRLEERLPELFGKSDTDAARRVRSDYRQTVSEMVLENYTAPWVQWANSRGSVTRNQAHGSPANLLDLYAAADIPETEVFGTSWVELTGLEPLEGTPRRVGGEAEVLACKLASSAAHVAGKPLVASESCTWLGEHFKVPLEHVKAELDWLFVMGINHVIFHALPYSPADAEWPGWLFYAETNFGPTNPFWRDLPALNAYIGRCQSFLQSGRPDNPVLFYLPISDIWSKGSGLVENLTVHSTKQWLDGYLPEFAAAGRTLWDRGYGFDFVSDKLLREAVSVRQGLLQSQGGAYQVLLVAGCTLMPHETLERIVALAREGATVLVLGSLPKDVPGLANLESRRREFRATVNQIGLPDATSASIAEARLGQGRILLGSDLASLLAQAGVARESIVDSGVELIRRRDENGRSYFLVNPTSKPLDGWTSMAADAQAAAIFDPMTGSRGATAVRPGADGCSQLFLHLEPGQSVIVCLLNRPVDLPAWTHYEPAASGRKINGTWRVEFVEGGPSLPQTTTVDELTSWTQWPTDAAALRVFSGTARYTVTFDKPGGNPDAWRLDLGKVCHSARVKLNGRDLGTAYARPFHLDLPPGLLRAGQNTLEIEVTNLAANRVADLDRRKVPWRKYFFVNILYKDFDASDWTPMESGLLGPVALVPLKKK